MSSGNIMVGDRGVTAYYKQRIWSGNNGSTRDEHAYSYQLRESFLPPYAWAYTFWPNFWFYQQSMTFCSPGLPHAQMDHTINLVNCATLKIQGELLQSNFNLGVFSGEFRESYGMICDIVSAFAKAIRYAKAKRFDKALAVLAMAGPKPRSLTGVAANSYMMTHFGIIPLCGDIKAAYKLMTTKYRVVKRVRRHCVYKDSTIRNMNGVSWQWDLKALCEIRGDISMVEINAIDRLGLWDLASVGWEVTRLSWLVDWLLPIGNFLQAVNARNQTQCASFGVTRCQVESLTHPKPDGTFITKDVNLGAYEKYYSPGAMNSRGVEMGLPVSFPTIENPLGDNLSRWVTSLAFLRQTVGR